MQSWKNEKVEGKDEAFFRRVQNIGRADLSDLSTYTELTAAVRGVRIASLFFYITNSNTGTGNGNSKHSEFNQISVTSELQNE